MELLEFPNKEIWENRNDWVNQELIEAERGCHLLSDHACALFMELQACYCIGAWVTVIVLSVSVIDAHLRETEASDTSLGTARLLKDYYEGEDIDWLRQLRNKYVHHNVDQPIFEMDAQFGDRTQMETDATKAMKMVISALFQNCGV